MLVRLKRKREEEPLVPHGLIWQATEDQLSEPMKSPAQKPLSVTQAREPFELPVEPAPDVPDQTEPSRQLGAISPPLPWPSPNIQPIHRRSAIPDGARPVITSSEQGANEQISGASAVAASVLREPETPKLKIIAKSRARSLALAIPRLRAAFNSFARRSRSLTLLVLQRAVVLRAATLRSFETAKIRGRIARGRNFAGTQLRVANQNGRRWASIADARARAGWHAFALYLESLARHGIQALGKIETASAQRALRRAWNLKVTVRIPASDSRRMIATFRGMQSQWYSLCAWARRDSRLLISFGMGALSAILAVGLVTTLRHFEPAASRGVVAADSKGANTPTQPRSVGSKSLGAANKQKSSPVIRKQAQPSAPRTRPAGNQSALNTVRPKPRRSEEEDDYIAKDTYVYYGAAGKPTRQ